MVLGRSHRIQDGLLSGIETLAVAPSLLLLSLVPDIGASGRGKRAAAMEHAVVTGGRGPGSKLVETYPHQF